jgi:cupin 2 domain-containing protein
LQTPRWRLERIHSNQARSPDGFWYDQADHEWVLLLQGSALLELEGEPQPTALSRGDQLLIPAPRRHRLLATDPDPGTIWLALFWPASGDG